MTQTHKAPGICRGQLGGVTLVLEKSEEDKIRLSRRDGGTLAKSALPQISIPRAAETIDYCISVERQ